MSSASFPFLPAESIAGTDWHEVTCSDGATYFFNKATRATSWKVPEEVAAARSRPPPLDEKASAMLARAAAAGAAIAPQYVHGEGEISLASVCPLGSVAGC